MQTNPIYAAFFSAAFLLLAAAGVMKDNIFAEASKKLDGQKLDLVRALLSRSVQRCCCRTALLTNALLKLASDIPTSNFSLGIFVAKPGKSTSNGLTRLQAAVLMHGHVQALVAVPQLDNLVDHVCP